MASSKRRRVQELTTPEQVAINESEDKVAVFAENLAAPQNPLLIDLVVENILSLVDNAEQLRSLRLLNKMWNRQALYTLRVQGQPLVRLILDKDRYLKGTRYIHQVDSLRILLLDLEKILGVKPGDKVPSFGIKINPGFYLEKNSNMNFLQNHGASLAEFDVTLMSVLAKILLPKNLTLPVCRKLVLRFTDERVSVDDFMVSLISACPKLQEFSFGLHNNNVSFAPSQFANFKLPKYLTKLSLEAYLCTHQLQIIFTNSPFNNLKSLTLQIWSQALEPLLLFQVLSKVSNSLEKLVLQGVQRNERRCQVTRVKFPLMPKLIELWYTAYSLELDHENNSDLGTLFPKLSYLQLRNQPRDNMVKFFRGSTFPQVRSFYPLMVSGYDVYSSENYHVSLDDRMVKNFCHSLPFLNTLEFYLYKNNVASLFAIYKNLANLSNLHVYSYYKMTPRQWTDCILGLICPQELEQVLIIGFGFLLQTFLSKHDPIAFPNGIGQMTNLRHLSFQYCGNDSVWNGPVPMIEDRVFQKAFLEMPRLTTISLGRGFSVSPKMREQWMQKPGRNIFFLKG